MKICRNGKMIKLTPEEIATSKAKAIEDERKYWLRTPYDEAVNAEIRKKYSLSQELSTQRQRDEKPEEYAEYYAYCEECKAYVKRKREEVGL